MPGRWIGGVWLVAVTALLAGCGGPYVLQGKAVQGTMSDIFFSSGSSSHLRNVGLEDVRFTVYRNPDSLGRKVVATGRSGPDGEFSIEVKEFGAGWMQEVWLIRAVRGGYQTAEITAALPSKGSGQRLVVVMAPGVSFDPGAREDEWQKDYDRYR